MDVGLVGAHDLVKDLFFGVGVDQPDLGPELDLGAGELARVNDLGAGEGRLVVADLGLDHALFFLGGMVLGVLAEVAVLAGDTDGLGDAGPLDILEALQFFAQACVAGGGHRDLVRHGSLYLAQQPS